MFNLEDFDIKLDTEELGRNFLYIDEVESTNNFLINSEDEFENGTVALAEFQNKGKGRRNREWLSQKDQNLTFSILLNKNLENINQNIINLATALSIAQAIEYLFQLNVDLKWPNDILVSGRKISGILLESSIQKNILEQLVIGVGINVNQPNFKGHFPIPPTSIRREFKSEVSREKLLGEIFNVLEENLYAAMAAPSKILEDWKSKCKMLGEKVKIESDAETKYGVFEDIDDQGFLMLKTSSGIEKIHSGDVSLR